MLGFFCRHKTLKIPPFVALPALGDDTIFANIPRNSDSANEGFGHKGFGQFGGFEETMAATTVDGGEVQLLTTAEVSKYVSLPTTTLPVSSTPVVPRPVTIVPPVAPSRFIQELEEEQQSQRLQR